MKGGTQVFLLRLDPSNFGASCLCSKVSGKGRGRCYTLFKTQAASRDKVKMAINLIKTSVIFLASLFLASPHLLALDTDEGIPEGV